MTSFVLKIIACVTMFIDHIGYTIFGKITWLNYIGRIAFPIFAYQIVEGYTHTKDLKKYFLRLLVFAIISQVPFMLFSSIITERFGLNVIFTLSLGLLCIWIWEKLPWKAVSVYIILMASIIAEVSNMDYGYWGVLLIFVFYLCKNNKVATFVGFFVMVLLKYLPRTIEYFFYYKYLLLAIATLLAIVPILLYKRKTR